MFLPHRGVFTRLQPSAIHGVGVFAILPIPAGTYIFDPDDEKLVAVSEDEISGLPIPLRTLYKDFCPREGGEYQCPSNFNSLTPAWFLNHSKKPNVAPDQHLRFYALLDIIPGEELTSDYSKYSDVSDQPFR
jgi:SET domain-containing protein